VRRGRRVSRSAGAGLGGLAVLLIATGAAAQDPRLSRLDSIARPLVAAVLDSARAAGLPAEPLVQRALEGVAKGAPSAAIVSALQRLATDLGRARAALGARATAPELEAGAAALRAGASPAVLADLRRIRHEALTVPLAVLADLTSGGVPVDSAAAAVLALAASARDAELIDFRRAVERDIALGTSAAAAAAAAANQFAATAQGTGLNAGARGARPGPP
jgi:hypothetical protein